MPKEKDVEGWGGDALPIPQVDPLLQKAEETLMLNKFCSISLLGTSSIAAVVLHLVIWVTATIFSLMTIEAVHRQTTLTEDTIRISDLQTAFTIVSVLMILALGTFMEKPARNSFTCSFLVGSMLGAFVLTAVQTVTLLDTTVFAEVKYTQLAGLILSCYGTGMVLCNLFALASKQQ